MRFQLRFANQLVGIFVIVGVLFAATAIVLLGSRQGWFEPRHAYRTEVRSSSNLDIGMPVKYRGFDVGRLTGFELVGRSSVEVDFVIFDRYRYLVTPNSLVEVSGNPLLGGAIVLHPGIGEDDPLEREAIIPEWDSAEGIAVREADLVERSQAPDAVSRLLEDINPVLDQVETLLASTEESVDILNRTLHGEMTEGPLAESFTGVNRLVDEAGSRLVETEILLSQTEALLADASAFSSNIGDIEGIIPRLVGTEGSIGRLFDDDDQLYLQVDSLLTSINESILELNQLVAFFGDETPQVSSLLEEGRDALLVGQDVLTGLRNNPLLRGGIPERRDPEAGFESLREG
ncbi:MAG: MlaD family protein, partial [Spirochaetota bacterium]